MTRRRACRPAPAAGRRSGTRSAPAPRSSRSPDSADARRRPHRRRLTERARGQPAAYTTIAAKISPCTTAMPRRGSPNASWLAAMIAGARACSGPRPARCRAGPAGRGRCRRPGRRGAGAVVVARIVAQVDEVAGSAANARTAKTPISQERRGIELSPRVARVAKRAQAYVGEHEAERQPAAARHAHQRHSAGTSSDHERQHQRDVVLRMRRRPGQWRQHAFGHDRDGHHPRGFGTSR